MLPEEKVTIEVTLAQERFLKTVNRIGPSPLHSMLTTFMVDSLGANISELEQGGGPTVLMLYDWLNAVELLEQLRNLHEAAKV